MSVDDARLSNTDSLGTSERFRSLLLKQRQLQYFSIAKPCNETPDSQGLTANRSANRTGELTLLLPSELVLAPTENAFVVHKSYLDDLSTFNVPFNLNVVGRVKIRPEPFMSRADIIRPKPDLEDWFYGYGDGLQILTFQTRMHNSITSWIRQAFLNYTPVEYVEQFAESSIFKFQESVWDNEPRTTLRQFILNSRRIKETIFDWLFDDFDYVYDELNIVQIAATLNISYFDMEDLISKLAFPVEGEK